MTTSVLPNTCENCNTEFIPTIDRKQRFCSKNCCSRYHNRTRELKPNVTYTCVICGKVVSKYLEPSKQAVNAMKYCSHKCQGIGFEGDGHPMWKGGRQINDQGYILIYKPEHPHASNRKTVREHILVMEEHIGRYLKKGEVVHHINEICNDNRIENLMLFKNQAEHKKYHESGRVKDEFGRYTKRK